MASPSRATPHGLLLLVLLLSYPLVQFVRLTFDRVSTVRDVSGTVHFLSEGRAGQIVLLGLSLVALLLAVHVVVLTWTRGGFRVSSWAVLAATVLVADALRPDRDVLSLLYGVMTVTVLVAAGVLRPSATWLSRVGGLLPAIAVSLLVYAAGNPAQGWQPCRPDKCSPAGALLLGYFPQENVVGMWFATLLPTLAYVRGPWRRWLSLLVVVATVVMTGSRTALVATVLALVAYVLLRRRAGSVDQGDAAKVLGVAPLLALGVSTVLVFTLSDMALTGRGLIFRIVREGWFDAPLFGPGRAVLEQAYYASTVNWYVSHEHGQAAYLLAEGGIIGLGLGVVALGALAVACWRSAGPAPALFALVPSLGFLTEPTWELTLRSPYILSLVLTASLTAAALAREPVPVPHKVDKPRGWRRSA